VQLRLLDEEALKALVDMPAAIAAVRAGFDALWKGTADVPVRTALVDQAGSTLVMPARLTDAAGLGLKVVTVRPENRDRGLPAIHAVILLLDAVTGVPTAVLDAEWLTALRTGAATGVATDLLARPDASVLAVVGAGAQAFEQVRGVATVRDLEEVRIVSRGGVSAERLARRLIAEGVVERARAVSHASQGVAGADIVVTVTDSTAPVVDDADIAPGTHLNAVGGYRRDMQELPVALVGRADLVVVDQLEGALAEAGDVTAALEAGLIERESLVELGALTTGDRMGRTSPTQLTVFKSVGNAIQDLMVARLALDRARGTDR
jgi:ornithine cyclodeaminase